jgi:hypothetical protein
MIYPKTMPENFPWGSMEDVYYKRFRDEIPDEWNVYYSVKFSMPDVPTREIDFLVISPRGILAIELKNEQWKVKDDRWYFYENKESWVLSTEKKSYQSPFHQVELATRQFKTFIKNRSGLELPIPEQSVGHAVFLLQNKLTDIPDQFHNHSILEGDLSDCDLYEICSKLYNQLSVQPLQKSSEQLMNQLLRTNFNFITSLKKQKKKQEAELFSLTHEQFDVLSSMDMNKLQMLLQGIGGSGKTLIALELAKRAQAQGFKTLFVCHSSNLNAYLQESCEEFQDIDVFRMVELCREIILEKEPDYGSYKRKDIPEKERITEDEYLKKILPAKTLEYIDTSSCAKKYDLLIMDEGQDLLTVDEMLVFDSILKAGFRDSSWLVCFDPRQALSGEIKSGIDYLNSFEPKTQFLKLNIRTPQKTFELACRLGRVEESGRLTDLKDPQLVRYKNPQDGQESLIRTINYITNDLKGKHEDILILSPLKKVHTEVLGRKRKLTDEIAVQLVEGGHTKNGTVGFSEIRRFKGLERPYVILTGVEDFGDESLFNQFFVALTRATSLGFLLYPTKALNSLKEALGNKYPGDSYHVHPQIHN